MRDTAAFVNLTGWQIPVVDLERARTDFAHAQAVAAMFPPPSGEYLAYLERQHAAVQEIAAASPLHDFLTRARAL